jgi:hypothetical protein
MYIKTLKPGQVIGIYHAGGTQGQGVRGKEENIVEVRFMQYWKGIGIVEFMDGTPVGLPISDGDVVMMEPINSIKNAFWDAGINVAVLYYNYNGLNGEVALEIIGYGARKGDTLKITCVDTMVYDVSEKGAEKLGRLDDENLVNNIKNFYKH